MNPERGGLRKWMDGRGARERWGVLGERGAWRGLTSRSLKASSDDFVLLIGRLVRSAAALVELVLGVFAIPAVGLSMPR